MNYKVLLFTLLCISSGTQWSMNQDSKDEAIKKFFGPLIRRQKLDDDTYLFKSPCNKSLVAYMFTKELGNKLDRTNYENNYKELYDCKEEFAQFIEQEYSLPTDIQNKLLSKALQETLLSSKIITLSEIPGYYFKSGYAFDRLVNREWFDLYLRNKNLDHMFGVPKKYIWQSYIVAEAINSVDAEKIDRDFVKGLVKIAEETGFDDWGMWGEQGGTRNIKFVAVKCDTCENCQSNKSCLKPTKKLMFIDMEHNSFGQSVSFFRDTQDYTTINNEGNEKEYDLYMRKRLCEKLSKRLEGGFTDEAYQWLSNRIKTLETEYKEVQKTSQGSSQLLESLKKSDEEHKKIDDFCDELLRKRAEEPTLEEQRFEDSAFGEDLYMRCGII